MMIKNTSSPTLYNFIASDTNNICQQGRVIHKVDDSRMRSHREDFRRNIDFLDPLLRLPQRGSFVNKQAVIINLSGDPQGRESVWAGFQH